MKKATTAWHGIVSSHQDVRAIDFMRSRPYLAQDPFRHPIGVGDLCLYQTIDEDPRPWTLAVMLVPRRCLTWRSMVETQWGPHWATDNEIIRPSDLAKLVMLA